MCVCVSVCLLSGQTFPKCDVLLDNEAQGSGVFLPELDEPEYCNPQSTALWELHMLKVTRSHTTENEMLCRCDVQVLLNTCVFSRDTTTPWCGG